MDAHSSSGGSGAILAAQAMRGKGGATNGTRTRDIQDHNLALYQLSYGRRTDPGGGEYG
jgi:hypothetical protein